MTTDNYHRSHGSLATRIRVIGWPVLGAGLSILAPPVNLIVGIAVAQSVGLAVTAATVQVIAACLLGRAGLAMDRERRG